MGGRAIRALGGEVAGVGIRGEIERGFGLRGGGGLMEEREWTVGQPCELSEEGAGVGIRDEIE